MISIENQYGTVRSPRSIFPTWSGRRRPSASASWAWSVPPRRGCAPAIRGKKTPDEGVRVRTSGGGLIVDLHIVVIYGMNIAAVTRSIVNRVRYTVEQATGLEVAKVNVFVDAMKTENA